MTRYFLQLCDPVLSSEAVLREGAPPPLPVLSRFNRCDFSLNYITSRSIGWLRATRIEATTEDCGEYSRRHPRRLVIEVTIREKWTATPTLIQPFIDYSLPSCQFSKHLAADKREKNNFNVQCERYLDKPEYNAKNRFQAKRRIANPSSPTETHLFSTVFSVDTNRYTPRNRVCVTIRRHVICTMNTVRRCLHSVSQKGSVGKFRRYFEICFCAGSREHELRDIPVYWFCRAV